MPTFSFSDFQLGSPSTQAGKMLRLDTSDQSRRRPLPWDARTTIATMMANVIAIVAIIGIAAGCGEMEVSPRTTRRRILREMPHDKESATWLEQTIGDERCESGVGLPWWTLGYSCRVTSRMPSIGRCVWTRRQATAPAGFDRSS